MAAKAVTIQEEQEAHPKVGEDIFFIAMPLSTYKMLSDSAMSRGLTFSQAMQQAFEQWLKLESKPKLLVEQDKR